MLVAINKYPETLGEGLGAETSHKSFYALDLEPGAFLEEGRQAVRSKNQVQFCLIF